MTPGHLRRLLNITVEGSLITKVDRVTCLYSWKIKRHCNLSTQTNNFLRHYRHTVEQSSFSLKRKDPVFLIVGFWPFNLNRCLWVVYLKIHQTFILSLFFCFRIFISVYGDELKEKLRRCTRNWKPFTGL